METLAPEGRRETRKRETRRALHDAALRLAMENGFQETTVADIARAAGVAPRTFFAYYPTKEAALYGPLEDLITVLESRLGAGERPDALDSFRSWVADDVIASGELEAVSRSGFHELAASSDTVAAAGLKFKDRVEAALAQGLRAQFGYSAFDATPEAAAAAVVAGLTGRMAVGVHATEAECLPPAPPNLLADVDRSVAFARAGLAAVRP